MKNGSVFFPHACLGRPNEPPAISRFIRSSHHLAPIPGDCPRPRRKKIPPHPATLPVVTHPELLAAEPLRPQLSSASHINPTRAGESWIKSEKSPIPTPTLPARRPQHQNLAIDAHRPRAAQAEIPARRPPTEHRALRRPSLARAPPKTGRTPPARDPPLARAIPPAGAPLLQEDILLHIVGVLPAGRTPSSQTLGLGGEDLSSCSSEEPGEEKQGRQPCPGLKRVRRQRMTPPPERRVWSCTSGLPWSNGGGQGDC